jgi:hypothetical protein
MSYLDQNEMYLSLIAGPASAIARLVKSSEKLPKIGLARSVLGSEKLPLRPSMLVLPLSLFQPTWT